MMYTLKFNFHTITNTVAVDALVYALSIELFLKNGIECVQPSEDTLLFLSDRDCTLAQLALLGRAGYTVSRIGG